MGEKANTQAVSLGCHVCRNQQSFRTRWKPRKEKMSPKPLNPESADAEDKALAMRAQGLTYPQIGKALGMTSSGAWKVCQRALARIPVASAEELRTIEGQRLDVLTEVLWPHVLQGNLQALNTLLKVMDLRARLFGLNAPVRQQVTLDTSPSGADIDAEMQHLVWLMQAQSEGRVVVIDESETDDE